MLKSWSIQNFKAIVDSGNLKLAPVTVLAGRNSSGKSSLLQSILMIAQTLGNKVNERALVTNGTIMQLGTFADILSDFSNLNYMTLKFEIVSDKADESNFWNHQVEVSFRSGSDTNISAIEAAKVVVDKVSIKSYSRVPLSENSTPVKHVSNGTNNDTHHSLTITQTASSELDYLNSKNSSRYAGVSVLRVGKASSAPVKLTILLYHFLPGAAIGAFFEPDEENDFDNISYTTESAEQIRHFFTSQIRYLGPLRADPFSIQQTFSPTGELDDVGSKGEYAATVYSANRLATVKYYNPLIRKVEHATLQKALNTWAKYLDVADEIKTEAAGLSGVTWKIALKQGQKSRSLPQVGVGVSQILPILVMGLLSPKGSLLIIEQPELHLHSRVQARLGDFFVGLSKCNKQCLIETHSENLVSQLRLHIVEAGGLENSDCMIYFVKQDEQGAAEFEEVEISKNGNILNWPDGFFDETMLQEDRITAASIKRRAGKAKNAAVHGE